MEIENEDDIIVDPREFVVEYTTVFVETEGVGDELDSDLKVLVESRVDGPVEAVDGVMVETEIVDCVIVDPSEFVVVYSTTDVESDGPNLGHV